MKMELESLYNELKELDYKASVAIEDSDNVGMKEASILLSEAYVTILEAKMLLYDELIKERRKEYEN